MSSSGIAAVMLHPGHKVMLVLGEGIITLSTLHDCENVCNDFSLNAKEPIVDDKKVSKVMGGLQNSHIGVYVRNN